MSTAPSTEPIQPAGVVGAGAPAQRAVVVNLGDNIDTAGTGGAIDVTGFAGGMKLELDNTGSGTIAVNVQHCMTPWDRIASSSPWQNERMAALGASGALAPVVGAQTVGATTVVGLELLDNYPTIRLVTSSANTGCNLNARLYLIPQ